MAQILKRPRNLLIIAIAAVIIIAGSWGYWELSRERLILATTTSTADTGLLDVLVPLFEEKYHAKVDVVAVGTGQAIATAEAGDADVVLVHSKSAELAFVANGNGTHRIGIMYNNFVIVGPSADPAGIKGLSNATKAFIMIAQAGSQGNAKFISRADGSGTNNKELAIWVKAKIISSTTETHSGDWYVETGQGMGETLTMTSEQQAYTLSDIGTWYAQEANLDLEIVVEGDSFLLNPYASILVTPESHPNVNYKLALTWIKFLISEETQSTIGNFKKGGKVCFTPIARDVGLAKSFGFPDQATELAWYDSQ